MLSGVADSMRTRLRSSLLQFTVLSLVGKVGEALAPWALGGGIHPFVLLAFNASDALCLLTTHAAAGSRTALSSWLIIASLRRVSEDTVHYMIGRRHGPSVVQHLGFRKRTSKKLPACLKALRRLPHKQAASLLFVGIAPSLPTCVAAGCSGIPPVAFIAADAVMNITRLLLLYAASTHLPLGSYIEWVIALLVENQYKSFFVAVAFAAPGARMAARRLWYSDYDTQHVHHQ
jgi:membrane protein DedA with SNARE-associated domain